MELSGGELMNDQIDRQAAIDALSHMCSEDENGITVSRANVNSMLRVLPSAQPESPRTFVELVVKYPDPELCIYKECKGKPYYSIKYIENGKTYVGYSTYNLEVLSQYLKEYFILSAEPEIIHCKDCKHHHKDNNGTYYCGRNGYGWKLNDFCSDAKRRTD